MRNVKSVSCCRRYLYRCLRRPNQALFLNIRHLRMDGSTIIGNLDCTENYVHDLDNRSYMADHDLEQTWLPVIVFGSNMAVDDND